MSLGAYILIMPDEVLVNTADTPVSVRYTAKPALSGTLFDIIRIRHGLRFLYISVVS